MNANELADELEALEKTASGNYVLVPCDKLAEMQAEIEALKKKIISLEFLARREK